MKSIFFDLDGTIIDISKRHYALYLNECIMLDKTPLKLSSYWKLKREKLPESQILQIDKKIEKNELKNILSWRQKNIEKHPFLKHDTLFPNCKKILQNLSETYNMIIITSRTSPVQTKSQLKELGILTFFNNVYSLGKNKYESSLNLEKADLMVGDTEIDFSIAQKLKIPFIFAEYGIRSLDYMKHFSNNKINFQLKKLTFLTCNIIDELVKSNINNH